MVRQVDMTFNEMHERCGISSSHWRTLQSMANGDPDQFDYLIEDYKVKIAKKKEKLANREKPIPASEYKGYVLTEDEFRMAIYEYIPTALASITKKKYYLQNMKALGPLDDLRQDIFFEIACKERKRSGKTMYQKYLDNVLIWKGYKQMVYRAAENLITDRVKKIVREGNFVSLDEIAYTKGDSNITVGEAMASTRNEHEQIFINEFLDKCKQKEIKGISLYDIAVKLVEGDGNQGSEVRLRDLCKQYNISLKKIRAAFEEIGTSEILG